jgi:hypothetical protein
MLTGQVYTNLIDSTIVINTNEQTTSTTELHSLVIRDIIVTLVLEQSTELYSRFELWKTVFQKMSTEKLKWCLRVRLYPLALKIWKTIFHELKY